MTSEQVSRLLRYMEHLRLASYEAESDAEECRLTLEYGRLWRAIQPYVEGRVPYADQPNPSEPK